MNRHLQPLSVPTFQVTRESIEGELPEWTELHEIVATPQGTKDWRAYVLTPPVGKGFLFGGKFGDYLALFPEPIGLTVLTPEQHEALLGEGGEDYRLPCDVFLAPCTVFAKGVPLRTLKVGMEAFERPGRDEYRLRKIDPTRPASVPITDEMVEDCAKQMWESVNLGAWDGSGVGGWKTTPSDRDTYRAHARICLEAAFSTLTPDGAPKISLAEAFDMGRCWEMRMQRPQVHEDSRAVNRELGGTEFEKIAKQIRVAEKELGFDGFTTSDKGRAQAVAIFHRAFGLVTPDDRLLGELKAWFCEIDDQWGNWFEKVVLTHPNTAFKGCKVRNIRPLYALSCSPGEEQNDA